MNSFPRVKLEENCELRGTDNVQGQISVHIFEDKWRLLCLLSFEYFRTVARKFWNLGNITRIFPNFGWGILCHVTCFDQSRASENIWWIIINIRQTSKLTWLKTVSLFLTLIFWWINTTTLFHLYPWKWYQTNAQLLVNKLWSFFRHKRLL